MYYNVLILQLNQLVQRKQTVDHQEVKNLTSRIIN